jgi:hypothetical protein
VVVEGTMALGVVDVEVDRAAFEEGPGVKVVEPCVP